MWWEVGGGGSYCFIPNWVKRSLPGVRIIQSTGAHLNWVIKMFNLGQTLLMQHPQTGRTLSTSISTKSCALLIGSMIVVIMSKSHIFYNPFQNSNCFFFYITLHLLWTSQLKKPDIFHQHQCIISWDIPNCVINTVDLSNSVAKMCLLL